MQANYHCSKESKVQPEQELETPVTHTHPASCALITNLLSEAHGSVRRIHPQEFVCCLYGCVWGSSLGISDGNSLHTLFHLPLSFGLFLSFPTPPLTFDFVCLVQRSTGSDVTAQICPINTILSNVVSAEPSFLLFVQV